MGKSRQLKDWISSFEEYTQHSESPRSFHLWAACSAVAAALQRRCYIKWGYETIYPNLYVVLIGPSGKARKSEPINISRRFVERLGIPILGEDNTQESIIREMKNAVQSFTDRSNKRVVFHSSVACFLEELAVFTGNQNTQFLAYLTNWYDSRDKWRRTTKHQGTDEIMGMCFNMLAASAPDWLPYILPREAIGGGFTSRCIFVVEERKSKIVLDPELFPADQNLSKQLQVDLELINTLNGPYEFAKDARELYTTWYGAEEHKIESGHATISDPLFSGYMSRRATHVKKIAMVMSASRGDDYVISAKDFTRARTLMEVTEKRMPRVFGGIGKARYAEETDLVLNYISRLGRVPKSAILRQFNRTLDNYSFDIVINVLTSMKLIKTASIGKSDTIYEYIGDKNEDHTMPPIHVIQGGKK